MRVMVIAVGKLKEREVRSLCDDYAGRIDRYARYDEVELKDGDAEQVTMRFERAIPDRARVIALEVDGQAMTSDGLARMVERAENDGVQSLVFLVGGAYGLPAAISTGADHRLSLSSLTLPHRIARLVLLEQIYRAFTISRNEPYSH